MGRAGRALDPEIKNPGSHSLEPLRIFGKSFHTLLRHFTQM